jgi:hypothetical protein
MSSKPINQNRALWLNTKGRILPEVLRLREQDLERRRIASELKAKAALRKTNRERIEQARRLINSTNNENSILEDIERIDFCANDCTHTVYYE